MATAFCPVVDSRPLIPTVPEVHALFYRLYGPRDWRPRLRHRFGFAASEERYAATVDRLVTPGCRWLDVGGGKTVLRGQDRLSRELADRCELLVGLDPSPNILANPFVHRRVQATIEDFGSDEQFDLATLRMVMEHIPDPDRAAKSLARLVRPGGLVVVYTPTRWSPVTIASSLIPNRWHTFFTRVLWGTNDEDVFPTVYRANTRRTLRTIFGMAGFEEAAFAKLANCSTLARFAPTCVAELCLWRILKSVGIVYPEHDLLGLYRRRDAT